MSNIFPMSLPHVKTMHSEISNQDEEDTKALCRSLKITASIIRKMKILVRRCAMIFVIFPSENIVKNFIANQHCTLSVKED